MARLWTCGLEVNDFLSTSLDNIDGIYVYDNQGAAAYTTTDVRSGVYAALFAISTQRKAWGTRLHSIPNGTSGYYRFYFRKSANPNDRVQIAVALDSNPSAVASLWLTTSGAIEFVDATGTVVTTSSALSNNTWYRVEMRVLRAASPTTSNGTWELRIDGTTIGSSTTANLGTNALAQTGFVFGAAWISNNTASLDLRFDDLAINDSTGADQTSWPGSGKVVHLLPTADFSATSSGFTDGAGGTTNRYDAVDNVPPNGVSVATSGAANQIESSAVKNTTDNFEATLQTYLAGGLSAGATVTLVRDLYSVAPNSATARSFGMTKTNNPSAAETTANSKATAAGTHANGNWSRITGSVAYAPSVTLSTAPRIKIRKATNIAEVASCDYMALIVEYTEPTPADLVPQAAAGQAGGSLRLAKGSYAAAAISLNPVGFWSLDETSGETALDYVGPFSDGDYAGHTLEETAIVAGGGTAVRFSGDGSSGSEPGDLEVTNYLTDTFASDTLANYTHSGYSSPGWEIVSGELRHPGGGNHYSLLLSEVGAVPHARVTGRVKSMDLWDGVMLSNELVYNAIGDYILMWAPWSDWSMVLWGYPYLEGAPYSGGISASTAQNAIEGGTYYWYRLWIAGTTAHGEVWAADPDLGGSPIVELSLDLSQDAGFEAALTGVDLYAGISGYSSSGRWDELRIDSAVPSSGILVPHAAKVNIADEFSFAIPFARDGTGRMERLVHKGAGAAEVVILESGYIQLRKKGTGVIATSTVAVNDTNDHFLIVAKNGSDVLLQLDGANVTGSVNNLTCVATSDDLVVG